MVRVGFKDAAKDGIQVIREGENGLEEVLGARIGTISGILERSLLPWVASTGEVDEDDTQAPDIVGGTHVVRFPGIGIQTF